MKRIGRLAGLVAGIAAAALAGVVYLAVPQPLPTAVAVSSAAEDTIVTGSIAPQPAPPPATEVRAPVSGSPGFQAALAALTPDGYAAAYALAKDLPDPIERRAVEWMAIYYGNGSIDASAVEAFSAEAPDFVVPSVFRTRLEQALVKGAAPGADVIRLLGGDMPRTLDAQVALAEAYLAAGQKDRAARIARAIWVDNYLDAAREKDVLARLGTLLTRNDHWARAEHLMMNDRAAAVERLMPLLSPAQQSLAVARNAVSRDDQDAKALLDKVDPSMQGEPVYIFSRAQWARQFQLYADALKWLDKAKGELPDAELWWYERRALLRQLLSVGNAKLAYDVAAHYTHGPEGRLVEARFNAGWIALSFLNDPGAAKTQFEGMAKLSTLPDSVTQANYWLGRALLALGDAKAARTAFTTAAEHGTVYYGLLARAELGLRGAGLREMPSGQPREDAFEARDVVKAIRLLAANGKAEAVQPLLRAFADTLEDGTDFLLAARLAQSIGAHHVAISIADAAEKRGFPLDLFSFPKDGLPTTALAAIDQAAVYAVTRQESRFQADAGSSAGALGLMQLMPATAKETAAKLGLDYSRDRLTGDPAYNTLLGSTYLATQLQRYDGSLLLAAAAYNAGAGNADKWVSSFGDPRADNVDPVVWVELIPFPETRKYVQRVLGNYLVYRTRLGDEQMTIGEALRRIPG